MNSQTSTKEKTKIVIATACDQYYFPLAKGLFLSLLNAGLPADISLAFVDLGCDQVALDWLNSRSIQVQRLHASVVGVFADEKYGYHRAQICRPFLPDIFPAHDILVWMDCDTWVQDTDNFVVLLRQAVARPDKFFAALELHIGYISKGFCLQSRIEEMYSYYEPIYGQKLASNLSKIPTINSGFVFASRNCQIWGRWKLEIENIYGLNFDRYTSKALHFAEQVALNKVLREGDDFEFFDPRFNFLCLWSPPVRSKDGVVRLNIPPYDTVGVLHLAGGWRHFGHIYNSRKLLFNDGEYLSYDEKAQLCQEVKEVEKFR